MIVYKDIEQRSPEWYAIRRGVLSASNFKYVITPTGKLAKSKTSRKFIRDLVLECLAGSDPHKEAANKKLSYDFAMNWGNDYEGVARQWFAEIMPVSEVGFVKMGEHIPIGCSPDGVIPSGDELGKYHSGLEIKCPSLSTHSCWLEDGVLPDEHKIQVHGNMAVMGLDSWHFLSYYPDDNLRIDIKNLLIEVERDEFTETVSESLAEFVEVYKSEFNRLSEIILAKEVAA